MNRYRRGSSTILSSRFGLAHIGAQLKVENSATLRTISNLIICGPSLASFCWQDRAYLPGSSHRNRIENQKMALPVPIGTRTLHAKRVPSIGGKSLIDENGKQK